VVIAANFEMHSIVPANANFHLVIPANAGIHAAHNHPGTRLHAPALAE
jgi:hypothetical protein